MDYYLIIVCLLFLLTISNLIVGVSNDAVNFLNSSVGSKAASFRTVVFIASIGILLGASFSDGMIDIARNGFFHPEMFSFYEIMIIFLSVMITNVLLLDLFNTFGLPTSSTVSLIFELLGAAVTIAIIKIVQSPDITILDLGSYINSSKAFAIIFSIFASVIIGFVFGALIQYIARLTFTFKLKKTMLYFGGLWCGLCFSLIVYFLVFKGMKGSTLWSDAALHFLETYKSLLLLVVFAGSAIIFQVIYWLTEVNVFRFVVLLGTMALAMAFAGNDLVNFIGVPIAGLNSYQSFIASGISDPMLLNMDVLNGPAANTPTYILVISGIIMIVTLYFSKQAKNVIQTEINLGRQDAGDERFGATPLSRSIVKIFVSLDEFIVRITPKKWHKKLHKRFKIPKNHLSNNATFDMLRASVNLMVAAALIAFGTSLKLPLSTTYITFMVAMGTSLSDGAWGRESAVFRITGVFTVIAGWFVTAIAAFALTSFVALAIYWGRTFAIVGILCLVVFVSLRSRKATKRKEQFLTKTNVSYLIHSDSIDTIATTTALALSSSLESLNTVYDTTISALHTESLKLLQSSRKTMEDMSRQIVLMKANLNDIFKLVTEKQIENFHYYVQAVNYLQETASATSQMVEITFTHTNNKHKPLSLVQLEELDTLVNSMQAFFNLIIPQIANGNYDYIEHCLSEQNTINAYIDTFNKNQMKRVKVGVSGTKSSLLFTGILGNTKNILLFSSLLLKAQHDFAMYTSKSSTY